MSTTRGDGSFYLGIDVGGTNIKAGVVSDAGESLSRVSVSTNAERGPEYGLEQIESAGRRAVADCSLDLADVACVGLATPGTMDIPAGRLLDPPNLPGWNDLPVRQLTEDRFGRPTILQNDANAAAYGEWWVGAGREAHSIVLWTLGTGIGCGIIVGDAIIQGEHSHGSECGHIIIQMDGGRPCDTGQIGTLEAYAGGKSLVRRCREALKNDGDSLLHAMIDDGKELTPLLIARAAEAGDRLADDLVMETARCLGVGTTTLMHTINPSMFLFAGAMTFGRDEAELGRRFIERIREEVRARAFPVPAEHTPIEYATLGGDAGYIGAAGCARRRHRRGDDE